MEGENWMDEADCTNAEADTVEDPLAHIRIQTGISDLAEHFDDYRFGLIECSALACVGLVFEARAVFENAISKAVVPVRHVTELARPRTHPQCGRIAELNLDLDRFLAESV